MLLCESKEEQRPTSRRYSTFERWVVFISWFFPASHISCVFTVLRPSSLSEELNSENESREFLYYIAVALFKAGEYLEARSYTER